MISILKFLEGLSNKGSSSWLPTKLNLCETGGEVLYTDVRDVTICTVDKEFLRVFFL